MTRLIFVAWLFSLGLAFHLGWWGRHRLTQRIKADAMRAVNEAMKLNATPTVIAQMRSSYWEAL
jgi:hypothetical protein